MILVRGEKEECWMSGKALLGSWLCVSVTAGVEICGDSICGNNICCCPESAEFAIEPLEKMADIYLCLYR